MTTKLDRARYEQLHALGCVACEIQGGGYCGPIEMHHLVDKGYKKHSGGNQATIPLGMWHHRAVPKSGLSKSEMRKLYGPSLADGSKPFRDRYGTQRELLERVNSALHLEVTK